MTINILEQLRKYSTIVADTGDIEEIIKYRPEDATTNPSLILKATSLPQYQPLINSTVEEYKRTFNVVNEAQLNHLIDKLSVEIGVKILEIIPGRVSTEIDARLSFDTQATIRRAQEIIELYQQKGYDSQRILIKIASTYEGIKAAQQLEKQGINCNLTLLFGLHQAKLCADAGITLISPFVGRVLDWYKKQTQQEYPADIDPGVLSVKEIYGYYKTHHYDTIIMAASFRS